MEQQVVPRILVLTGPTASGKSAVGLHLAERYGGEIVSADSRQVFKDVSIGTAKPTPEELHRIRHHFIDHVELNAAYTAGTFAREAMDVIRDIFSRGRLPIVVGGSGLYVQALVEGIFNAPETNPELRAELDRRACEEGVDALWDELMVRDPESAHFVPKTNIPRVIRALEVCILAGEPYSRIRVERMEYPPFQAAVFGLQWNREELYERINKRTEEMIALGLVDEVRALLASGADSGWQSLNTVGYKETIAYLRGTCSFEKMVADIQQHTRNFAKRQLTWFRKKTNITWIPIAPDMQPGQIAERIYEAYLDDECPVQDTK